MFLSSLWKSASRSRAAVPANISRKASRKRPQARRLRCEALEDRRLLSFDPGWLVTAGGAGGSAGSNGVTADSSGNLYTYGWFSGTVNFDPNGTCNLTSAGGNDAFVAKYSPTGSLLWARRIGSTGDEWAGSPVIDQFENVWFVAGFWSPTVDFDPLATHPGDTDILTNRGVRDIVVMRLDPNGNFLSVVQEGGAANDNGGGMKLGPDGYVYQVATTESTTDFSVGSLVPTGSGNWVLTKFDPASGGSVVWTKRLGVNSHAGTVVGAKVAVDND